MDAKPKNYAFENKNPSYLKMIILFLFLMKLLAIKNKAQETTTEEDSYWGKQTSAEVGVTWKNFLHELLRAAAQHGHTDSLHPC